MQDDKCDICFIIDTTKSMDSFIKLTKDTMIEIINKVSVITNLPLENFRTSAIAYKDLDDED